MQHGGFKKEQEKHPKIRMLVMNAVVKVEVEKMGEDGKAKGNYNQSDNGPEHEYARVYLENRGWRKKFGDRIKKEIRKLFGKNNANGGGQVAKNRSKRGRDDHRPNISLTDQSIFMYTCTAVTIKKISFYHFRDFFGCELLD